MEFLLHLSDFSLFFLVNVSLLIIAVLGVLFVRRFVPKKLLYKDEPVIGSLSALVGVIYGVLAGLTALYLFNNLNYASNAVQSEASAVADLYRDTHWLQEPTRSEMQKNIRAYLHHVIDVEWPIMQQNSDMNFDGELIIEKIGMQLRDYKITSKSEFLIFNDMLAQVKSLYDARAERINTSHLELSNETWVVILIGTLLTLAVNFMFNLNVHLHLFTAIVASLILSSMLFLLLTLDRPFQGEFTINANAFQTVLDFINLKK